MLVEVMDINKEVVQRMGGMIITRTPLRIPIGGGGTDLPFYYKKFGGSLVTATIDKYVYVTVKKKFDGRFRISYSKTENVDKIDEIQHSSIREALRLLDIKKSMEITTIGDIPSGAGLGSSGTFLVGLLHALYTYKRESVSIKRLAEEACKIEMEILKEPVGHQDQYAAAFGGLINMDINNEGKIIVSPLNVPEETIRDLENNIFLFYTGILRKASEVLESQKKAAEKDSDKLDYLTQIKKIGRNIKKALENDNAHNFGSWLNTHWETKRKLSNSMTNPQIDNWYNLALKNGAIGGKIMGAGGGGCFMFYCEKNHKKFLAEMQKAGLKYFPFKFDLNGTRILFNTR